MALIVLNELDANASVISAAVSDDFVRQAETIFMKLRSRSSRATAPKIRVPRGVLSLSISTTALLSNLM